MYGRTAQQQANRTTRESRRDGALRAPPGRVFRPPIMPGGGAARFVKAPSGGIPARVSSVLGEASCSVYKTGDDGLTLEDTGDDIDVVNWGVEAACVNGERYGVAVRWDGLWWIVSEDCADDQEGTVASRSLTVGTTAPSEAFATDPSPSFIYPKRVVPKFTIPLGLSYSA